MRLPWLLGTPCKAAPTSQLGRACHASLAQHASSDSNIVPVTEPHTLVIYSWRAHVRPPAGESAGRQDYIQCRGV